MNITNRLKRGLAGALVAAVVAAFAAARECGHRWHAERQCGQQPVPRRHCLLLRTRGRAEGDRGWYWLWAYAEGGLGDRPHLSRMTA